jgi:hypothetical protein
MQKNIILLVDNRVAEESFGETNKSLLRGSGFKGNN